MLAFVENACAQFDVLVENKKSLFRARACDVEQFLFVALIVESGREDP